MESKIIINIEMVKQVVDLRKDRQLEILIEESSELIQASIRQLRILSGDKGINRESVWDNFLEEIADVYLTLKNIVVLYDMEEKDMLNLKTQAKYKMAESLSGKDKEVQQKRQLELNIEKCSELIQSLSKQIRVSIGDNYLVENTVYLDLRDKMATTYASLENLILLFGIEVDAINSILVYKQLRLKGKIETKRIQ